MSDYSQVNDYSVKDGLSSGDPNKLIKGADVDADLAAIATAIATKYDSTDLASSAQAIAETDNTVLMTPLRVANWADGNDGVVGDLQALTGVAADRLLFWDQSAGAAAYLTVSTGLTISGTNITTDDAAIVHDSLSGFVADEHVAHSSVSISAGTGLSGGGTIAATRTLSLSHLGLESLTAPAGDRIAFYDLSGVSFNWLTVSTGLTLSGTSLTTNDSAIVHDSLSGFVADEHVAHSGVSITAGAGLTGGGTIAATRTLDVGAGTGIAVNANDVALSHLGLETLTAPAGDRIAFYDLSGVSFNWLTVSTGLTIAGTSLTTNDSAIVHDSLSGFVADEHVAHSGVTLTAGEGISGGGTIAASRSFALDLSELTASTATDATDLDADFIAGWDTSAGAQRKIYAANLMTPELVSVATSTDTLDETDFGKLVQYSYAGAVAVTLPNGLKTGFWAVLQPTGATTTLSLSATTTLNTADSLTSVATRYACVTVFHTGSNVWTAWGALE